MAGDITLHHDDTGSGAPPLVFVHGYMGRLGFWQPQIDHFKGRHRVLGCDLRGHGRTPPGGAQPRIGTLGKDVAALIEQLGLAGAVLVGHSMGCRVVLEARRHVPDRIAALVLVDGSNMALGDEAGAHARLDAAMDAAGFAAFARALLAGMFIEGHDPTVLKEIIATGLKMPESFGRPLFHGMIAYDADESGGAVAAMRACDVPVLIVQSTAMGVDRVRRSLKPGESAPYVDLARQHVPRLQVAVVPGVGHYVQLDAPAAVNGHIEAFLARGFG